MEKYIYELKMKVRDYECDLQGIVNNANYQHYLEHTRHEFLTSVDVYKRQASTRSTPFISSSKSRALIRLTGILVSTTNVLICNPSGLLFNNPTTFSSSSLKSGNSSRCRGVDDVFSLSSLHPMVSTKSLADKIRAA